MKGEAKPASQKYCRPCTPDNTGVVEGFDGSAGERSRSCTSANVLDCAHGPLDCGKLAKTRPDSGNQLSNPDRSKRKDDGVPRHTSGGEVPPGGHKLVLAHELHVDVIKLTLGRLEAAPDLRTMEQVEQRRLRASKMREML
ncbi:hypothetical protein KCU61_g52, partial [Aureobasidium melanogenum]